MPGITQPVHNLKSRSQPLSPCSDDECIAARSQHDPAAFADLFNRYLGPVYWYCYSRLRDHAAAEDATSAIFEKAFSALTHFDPGRGQFRSWLFRIAHNVIVDDIRRQIRQPGVALDGVLDLAAAEPTPEEAYLLAERQQQVMNLLPLLPDGDRQVIELRLAGLTAMEISEVLGRNRGAVDSAQNRAVTRLRQLLAASSAEMEARRVGS